MSIESRVLKNYTGVLNGISVTGLPQEQNKDSLTGAFLL
jgi:hypothetical protein